MPYVELSGPSVGSPERCLAFCSQVAATISSELKMPKTSVAVLLENGGDGLYLYNAESFHGEIQHFIAVDVPILKETSQRRSFVAAITEAVADVTGANPETLAVLLKERMGGLHMMDCSQAISVGGRFLSDRARRPTIRVAIASSDGKTIDQGLEAADILWIFDLSLGRADLVEARPRPAGREGFAALLPLLADCSLLMAQSCPPGATSLLESMGTDTVLLEGEVLAALEGLTMSDIGVRAEK